jgi:nucleoside-diphosphate-sugar epimerase
MKHALVTGAAGFIGSHLAAGLLRQGWQVTGLDARYPASDPVTSENLAELTPRSIPPSGSGIAVRICAPNRLLNPDTSITGLAMQYSRSKHAS